MKAFELILTDKDKNLCSCWKREFQDYPGVVIRNDDAFTMTADAIVSPANSFGIMDGGFDGKLRDYFGVEIEQKVRRKIREEYDGELPVGLAILTKTGNSNFPYLISAPTMRVPEEVKNSINAYLAMKAILNCVKKHDEISSIVCTGLCTLSGRMEPKIAARQMRAAYDRTILGKNAYSHWREERSFESFLKCETDDVPYDLERPLY